MTRFSFVLLFAVCIGMSACIAFAEENAQKGAIIRGKVVETDQPQNPIEGVEIQIIAAGGKKVYTAKSNTTGNFECTGILAGRYIVMSEKKGYIDDNISNIVVVVDGVEEFLQLKMINRGNRTKQRIKPLIHHVTENIGKRYELDKTVVEDLHQSIYEAVETAINRGRNIDTQVAVTYILKDNNSMKILGILLSRPDCKAAFAKHLTETQLQDYIDLTNTRRQRQQQIILHHIIALLDQELILTADQYKNIGKLLLDKTDELKLTSMETLRLNSQKAITLVNSELRIQLSEILTETQEKLWQVLITQKDTEAAKSLKMILTTTKVAMKKAVDEGVITEEQAAARLDELEKQLGIVEKSESQRQMKQFLEAKLAVYTEILGTLDERASQRLTIATKGVVQQYLEAKERLAMYYEAEEKIMAAVAAREITPEQANEKLGDITEELWGENIAYEETGEPYGVDITKHPLYQKAIKEVLSEEAYAQYNARQMERTNFHQQVLRDLAVAIMDTRLLLNDTQRKQLEATAAQLTAPPSSPDAPMDMFYRFYQHVDRAILSPWQRNEIELLISTN